MTTLQQALRASAGQDHASEPVEARAACRRTRAPCRRRCPDMAKAPCDRESQGAFVTVVSDRCSTESLAAVALQQIHRVDRNRVAVDALRVEVHDAPSARCRRPSPVDGLCLVPPLLERVGTPYTGAPTSSSPYMLCRSRFRRVARNGADRRTPHPRVAACRAHTGTMPPPTDTRVPRSRRDTCGFGAGHRAAVATRTGADMRRRGGEDGGSGMVESSSLPARRRVGVRPDSSVVEHLHGKEKVKSSILFRGSDRPTAHPADQRSSRRGSSGG